MGKTNNFLEAFVQLGVDTEIPPEFLVWSGLFCASCCLGRRCYIDMGTYTLYPNFYIIFAADSGIAKKSTSIKLGRKFLERLEPRPNVLSESMTKQSLIQGLTNGSVMLEVGVRSMEGIIMADELTTLINKHAFEHGLGDMLTTLFDCPDYHSYSTAGRGKEELENVYLSLLGGSTFHSLRKALPESAIGGGFTSRVLFIHLKELPSPVLWTYYDPEKVEAERVIIKKMEKLRSLQGKVEITQGARKLGDSLYRNFRDNHPFCSDPILAGYASRRFVHVLKLACVVNAIRREELRIDEQSLNYALNLIEGLEQHLPRIVRLLSSTDIGVTKEMVLNIIKGAGKITAQQLQAQLSHLIQYRELLEILETLRQGAEIEVHHSTGIGAVYSPARRIQESQPLPPRTAGRNDTELPEP